MLHRLYNGMTDEKISIDPNKILTIQNNIDVLSLLADKLPNILSHAVSLAGNKFL